MRKEPPVQVRVSSDFYAFEIRCVCHSNNEHSLLKDGQLTSTKLNDLYKRLDDLKNVTKEIANLTDLALQIVEKAEANLTKAESIVGSAHRTLTVRSRLHFHIN